MRDEDEISDEVMRDLENNLDLEQVLLESPEAPESATDGVASPVETIGPSEETPVGCPGANEVQVENNAAEHRFEARFPEGLAMLKYHYDRSRRLSLDHTEVPPPCRHHGVATLLAKAAFDFAQSERLRVLPRCPYVIAYLEAHPEVESLVDRSPLP